MSNISNWFDTAAGNDNLNVPDGAPEGATNNRDLNNIIRELQAAIRRQWNEQGWFEYGDGSGPYAAVFLAGNSFQIQGVDATVAYGGNVKVRITQGATVLVGFIDSSVFTAGNTDVTVILASGEIDNITIDSVELGLAANPSPASVQELIRDADRDTFLTVEQSPDDDALVAQADGVQVLRATKQAIQTPAQPRFSYFYDGDGSQDNATGSGFRHQLAFPSQNFERGTMMNASFNQMTAVVAGVYDVRINLALSNIDATATEVVLEIERSDDVFWRWELSPVNLQSNITDYPIPPQSRLIEMAQGQTLKVFVTVDGMAGNTVDILGSTDRNRTEWSAMLVG